MARDVSYLKPKRFRDHMTLSEVCERVGKDPSWIRLLEKQGRIPKAARVTRGGTQVRLWSPEQVEEIAHIISAHRPGRPKNG